MNSSSATSVAAGEALCQGLEELGARHLFALPGTQVVPMFEALRRSRLATVVPTHELAASMMAAAYFRASGRPGLLLTIPGPGFTYALTGIAEARLDSSALVHFVPAVTEGPQARFALQAISQTAIAHSLYKAVLGAARSEDLPAVTRRAHEMSLAGEPGPVLVQLGGGTAGNDAGHTAGPDDTPARIAALWSRIRSARRPVIFAGQGCLHDAPSLRSLAEQLKAPVVTTASARGVLPEDHPLAMGFDAHRGTAAAVNGLLEAADLIVVLGAKLGHNGTAGHALRLASERTIRVDADPDASAPSRGPAMFVAAPVDGFLSGMESMNLPPSAWTDSELAAHRTAIRTHVGRPPEPIVAGLAAPEFFLQLRAALPRETIVVTDTGLHQVMARRHLEILSPGGILMPSDFQSMGFGLPAAIAAKLAAPERPVILLIGDGGIAMSGLELATAARLGLSTPVVVFDDGQLNQIRLHQQAEFGRDFGVESPPIDLAALASATGAAYAELGDRIADELQAAMRHPGPTLLRLPVGDSRDIRRARTVARAKAVVRQGLGQGLTARLRRLLGRG